MEKEPVTLQCCHADTCLPDYWGGHHRPHVQVSVRKNITFGELKKDLINELNQSAVAGSDRPEDDDQEWYEAAVNAVNNIELVEPHKGDDTLLFKDLEESGEDDPSVYAFFVFLED